MSPEEVVSSHDGCDGPAVTDQVVAILSQKALLMCPYVSSGKFSVLAPRCSCALLHILQPTSDRYLIFASQLAAGMIPAIAIVFRLQGEKVSCLQGMRKSFKYFSKNALLSCFHNMKSAVHVPYAGRLILSCSALACTHDFKIFFHLSKCFTVRISPYFDMMPHIVACVCSPLCHHLCTIFHIVACVLICSQAPASFMFLHPILCCPSSNCICQAIIKLNVD